MVSADTTGGIPNDYRSRHPISLKEGKKSLALFVGSGRGGLSPVQRAEVLAFAQNWKRDATGGITIEASERAGLLRPHVPASPPRHTPEPGARRRPRSAPG